VLAPSKRDSCTLRMQGKARTVGWKRREPVYICGWMLRKKDARVTWGRNREIIVSRSDRERRACLYWIFFVIMFYWLCS